MRGELAIFFSAILMSSVSIFVRNTGEDALAVTFLRLFFATLFLFIFAFLRKEKFAFSKILFMLALLNLITIFSYISAIQQIEVGISALLLYMAPIYVTIIAYISGEKIERTTMIALPLGFIGLYLMLSPYVEPNLGIIFGVVSGITYSLVFTLSKKAREFHSAFQISFFNVFLGSSILLPYFLLKSVEFSLFWAVGLGLIPTAIPFMLFAYGMKHVKLQKAPLIALVEPMFAVIVGYIYFGEVLNEKQILGGTLILLSTAMSLHKD
ncbi:MAG: EamA family transporter [Archaeoglobaceae archaeon]|nr:DMT family transporter [Archaeoglobaceae archaeon]MDW7989189.1 EamA family transporter [Archaeoglobaceae archaeon]